MEIFSDRMYYVTDNCEARIDAQNNFMRMLGQDIIELDLDVEVDRRIPLVSFSTGKDLVTYINYIRFLSIVSYHYEISTSNISNRFVNLLDLGYVPLILPPVFIVRGWP